MAETEVIDGELIESPAQTMAAGPGQTMMKVQTSYATAMSVPKPRALAAVERRLLEECRLAGESFYYGWGNGKDRVEGPSIGLAMAAARCWGNCAVEVQPMQETADAWIFTVAFVDLETGFTVARQLRQSKRWTVYGKLDAERKDDMRFQIGQSKATRNVILNALPAWLMDKAMQEAKAGVREKIEAYVKDKGMAAAVDMIVKALAKLGVNEAAVTDKFSIAKLSALTVDHLVILRGDLAALQAGQERPESLFPLIAKSLEAAAGEKPQGSKSEQLGKKLKGKTEDKPEQAPPSLQNLKPLLEACRSVAEMKAIRDQLCGPESQLSQEDIAQASAICQTAIAELEAKERTGKEAAGKDKLFDTHQQVGQ